MTDHTKHTKGPWRQYSVHNPKCEHSQALMADSMNRPVCYFAFPAYPETMANVELIQRAPEMAAEIERLRETVKMFRDDCQAALDGKWDRSDEGFRAMVHMADAALKGGTK